jgi:hypothetical protein
MVSVGDNADLSFFPSVNHPRIKGVIINFSEFLSHYCILLISALLQV